MIGTPVPISRFKICSGESFPSTITSARSELPCAEISTRSPRSTRGKISCTKYGSARATVSFRLSPPGGESLRDTAARVLPYYIQDILPRVLRGERVLVAAHGNSLRALVMVLDRHTTETITKLNLDTGVPMIYRLNADSTVASKLDLAA